MQDLSAYRILRVIDSNNVVIIRNQKNIIEANKCLGYFYNFTGKF